MADYMATIRSNYVCIKDPTRFEDFIEGCGLTVITQPLITQPLWWELGDAEDCQISRQERRTWKTVVAKAYGFHNYESDGIGGLPGYAWDPVTKDHIEIDFLDQVATHLVPGQVMIIQEAGAEKARYINGYAWAVNAAGKTVQISLNEIYDKARHLTSPNVQISPCEY
jgi:hypothetical protein